jgi:hypothetical protein
VLILDDTGDLKKGVASLGTQRQYTGTCDRDVEPTAGGAATDRYRVGGAAERGLRDPDHRNVEPRVGVRTEPGPPLRIEVDVAVDDQQVDRAGHGQHGVQRGQFTSVEVAGTVGRDLGQPGDVLTDDGGERASSASAAAASAPPSGR